MPISTILNSLLDNRRSRGVTGVNRSNQGERLTQSVLQELLGDEAFEEQREIVSNAPQRRLADTRQSEPAARRINNRAAEDNTALGEGQLLRGLLRAVFQD